MTNYLSVPDLPLGGKSTQFELPGGFIPNGDLAKLAPITGQNDETWRRAVTEDSTHAWYKGGGPLHPWKGETDPEPTEWDEEKEYSWVKAPRYNGQPAQVGPLAKHPRRLRAGQPAHEEVDRRRSRRSLPSPAPKPPWPCSTPPSAARAPAPSAPPSSPSWP